MKHAYLILAHNEFALLQTLISCIDDARNDIYVHIDKKVKALPELHTKYAGLQLTARRIDIHWGGFSMVEAEYVLLEEAAAKGPYQYYHLLSGVDLPLKSQDYINDFFNRHNGKEFIGYTLNRMTPELERRMQRWHLFSEHFSRNRDIFGLVRSAWIKVQEVLGIKRNRNVDFKKGSQWASMTESFVRYLLEHKAWAEKTFRHTFVPDESVLQTLCWMSPCRSNIFNTEDDALGCMRAIGWKQDPDTGRWSLIDWNAADYGALTASPALFARKFNSKDMSFIEKIVSLSQQ
ncbi:MAG: glycosyl transferase [Bacteroidales bacterium]|nr:glycosyl transferase [Bacteroidales bacterium]